MNPQQTCADKKEIVRANEVPYMTKTPRKSIMKISELVSKYLKNKSYQNMKIYKKQENILQQIYRKGRKKIVLKLIHVK